MDWSDWSWNSPRGDGYDWCLLQNLSNTPLHNGQHCQPCRLWHFQWQYDKTSKTAEQWQWQQTTSEEWDPTNKVYISDVILSWLLVTNMQNQTNTLLHWGVRSSYLGFITLKLFGRDQHGQTARHIPSKWFTMAERFLQYSLSNLMNKNSRLLGTRIKKTSSSRMIKYLFNIETSELFLGNHFWFN